MKLINFTSEQNERFKS